MPMPALFTRKRTRISGLSATASTSPRCHPGGGGGARHRTARAAATNGATRGPGRARCWSATNPATLSSRSPTKFAIIASCRLRLARSAALASAAASMAAVWSPKLTLPQGQHRCFEPMLSIEDHLWT